VLYCFVRFSRRKSPVFRYILGSVGHVWNWCSLVVREDVRTRVRTKCDNLGYLCEGEEAFTPSRTPQIDPLWFLIYLLV